MTAMGSSPEKAGKRCSCLSKTICAVPRRKIEAPMVMMISATTEALRAGSIASLLSAMPTATATRIAASAASHEALSRAGAGAATSRQVAAPRCAPHGGSPRAPAGAARLRLSVVRRLLLSRLPVGFAPA